MCRYSGVYLSDKTDISTFEQIPKIIFNNCMYGNHVHWDVYILSSWFFMLSRDSPDVVIVTSEVLWVRVCFFWLSSEKNKTPLFYTVLSDTHIPEQDVTDFVITPRVLGNV